MLSTRLGSADGIATRRYLAGETYEVPPSLARVFLGEGWAERGVERKDAGAAPRNKALARAPHNKALARAPHDKAAGSRLSAQHRGFGRWYLVDPAGARVSGPYASRTEAEARL